MHLYLNGPKSVFLQVAQVTPELLEPPAISYGSSISTQVRVNKVQFGDGYQQRSLDGINAAPLMINFSFSKRSLATITEIKKFFEGDKVFYDRTPDEYFLYIPPAPYDGGIYQIPRKFVCLEWNVSANEHNNYTLSGKMEEVFEP